MRSYFLSAWPVKKGPDNTTAIDENSDTTSQDISLNTNKDAAPDDVNPNEGATDKESTEEATASKESASDRVSRESPGTGEESISIVKKVFGPDTEM